VLLSTAIVRLLFGADIGHRVGRPPDQRRQRET